MKLQWKGLASSKSMMRVSSGHSNSCPFTFVVPDTSCSSNQEWKVKVSRVNASVSNKNPTDVNSNDWEEKQGKGIVEMWSDSSLVIRNELNPIWIFSYTFQGLQNQPPVGALPAIYSQKALQYQVSFNMRKNEHTTLYQDSNGIHFQALPYN